MAARNDILKHIKETYNVESEHLWPESPDTEVLRHNGHKKWFGIIMTVSNEKVGLNGDGYTDIMNVKCEPERVMFLKHQTGFAPAYHMNKMHWISIILNGSAPDALIYELIDNSYNMTE
ncbi:MAG: MmcQ/YjbR family DNA-binding protein [Clostridia bacterium]|nr:MmcQ/YjbR family DNA-binding protein [Clostridia bacterium]